MRTAASPGFAATRHWPLGSTAPRSTSPATGYWYFFRRRQDSLSLGHALDEDKDACFTDLVASTDQDPAQEAAHNEFSELVATCMEQLDRDHREILAMRNLSYDEIARTLDINVGTV